MPAIIHSLPAETLSLIFELVRTTTNDYWQAQATLRCASLVSRSWRNGAQRELAYEVRIHSRTRQIFREGYPPRQVIEHSAESWLQSLACCSRGCRIMTLPARLVDATVDAVIAQCEGLVELSVESWVSWGMLRSPALADLKTLRLDASLTDPNDDDNSFPFRLAHLIWDNASALTARLTRTLFTHSASSITTLTLIFAFPGLPLDGVEHLPLLLPHLRHLKLHFFKIYKDEYRLFSSCAKLETLSCTPALGSDLLTSLRPLLDALTVKLRELSLGGAVGTAIAKMTTAHPLLEHPTLSELEGLSCEGVRR